MNMHFQTQEVINLAGGEYDKQVTVQNIPRDKLFVIEFVGIDGFAQEGQNLYMAVDVGGKIYPIEVSGTLANPPDPQFPQRIFGSQLIRLYVNPGANVNITVARYGTRGSARVFVALSGSLMDVDTAPPAPPTIG